MRRRDWLGVVLVSILGHVALFWPGAAMYPPVASSAEALNVTFMATAQQMNPLPVPVPLGHGLEAGLGGAGLSVGSDGQTRKGPTAGVKDGGRPGVSSTAGLGDGTALMMKSAPEVQAIGGAAQSDAPTLDSYRFALAREVLRIQRYPVQSLEAGQGGAVELEVRFPKAGRSQPLVSILASSGWPALDEAALGAIHEGMRNIPSPGGHGSLRLSVLFEVAAIDP